VPADRQATYREIFANVEYRALFSAGALSSIGDYLGKVAIAALVYQITGSVLYSAASLAITYLPWLTGAPFLVALAERYPYRRVMLMADLGRMVLVGAAAIPGLPLPAVPALMFLAALISPPFDASRSALMPTVLDGDRYVLGLSLNLITGQAAQVGGYVFGGLLSTVNPRLALGIDAATFGVSALLILACVAARPAVPRAADRHLVREMADGFTVVFGNPVLRGVAIVILAAAAFAILPEGLAAGWSDDLHAGSTGQGLIMAAGPLGTVLGGVVISRLLPVRLRQRTIRPLATLVPLSLVAALLSPPLAVVLVLTALTGFAMAVLPPANGLFVQALPNAYRARAFGIMQGGLQLVQGAVIFGGGAVAREVGVPRAVGGWALVGLAIMLVLSARWPKPAAFDKAIADAKAANEEAARGPSDTGTAGPNGSASDRQAPAQPAGEPQRRLAEQM
jgi:transmembrane secretion effector